MGACGQNPLSAHHVGRVKGDGNCLWRSLGHLAHIEWQTLKTRVLAEAPTLSAEWCAYWKVSNSEYDKAVAVQQPNEAWGSEIGIALAAKHLQRPIVVVTPAIVWLVTIGSPDLQKPLIIRLQSEHYDPIKQAPSQALLHALAERHPRKHATFALAGRSDHQYSDFLEHQLLR